MQSVKVTWLDSTQTWPGWIDIDEAKEFECATCTTVGYLVDTNEDVMILAKSYNESASQVEGVCTIPNVCVVDIDYL